MYKAALVIMLLLLLTPISSEQKIVCEVSKYRKDGCIIGIYDDNLRNTHASICNQPSSFYYMCYINTNKYIIPINVTTRCSPENKILFYLYNEVNSHISIIPTTIPVCLDKRFSKVIDVINNYSKHRIPRDSIPILGLYLHTNTHIQGKNGRYTIFLHLIDRHSPEIYTSIPNNSYIQLPTILKIEYKDDNCLYLCGYRILEIDYREEWYCYKNSTKSVVLSKDLCKNECTLEIYAVDLVGNINEKVYGYYVSNPKITLEMYPHIGTFVSIDVSSLHTYILRIINTGTSDLKDVYLWREGCEEYVEVTVNGNREITFPVSLGNLNIGDKIAFKITISPLRIGRCTLKIIANATDTKLGSPVKDTIEVNLEIFNTVGPLNIMVVDDPAKIPILILITTLIILLY